MLKLRLSMGGTKKRPVYKIVVADSKFPRGGRFIEKLGCENLEEVISNILLKHKSYVGIAPGAGEKNKIWPFTTT